MYLNLTCEWPRDRNSLKQPKNRNLGPAPRLGKIAALGLKPETIPLASCPPEIGAETLNLAPFQAAGRTRFRGSACQENCGDAQGPLSAQRISAEALEVDRG